MKSEIIRYEKGQIWLLTDASIVLITNVDEVTKLHSNENDRRCNCVLGHRHIMNEQFRNRDIVVVEDSPTGAVLSFDVSAGKTFTLSELRRLSAAYLGVLTPQKSKEFTTRLIDYYER